MALQREPHERLLNRHVAAVENKEYMELLDKALSGLINEAKWLFSRCWESRKGNLTAEVVLLLGRHVFEMADAVHVLLLKSASRPAQLQLRSAFEAVMYMAFISETDSNRRALAYGSSA